MSVRLCISGATGRMGQSIARLSRDYGFDVVSALTAPTEAGATVLSSGAPIKAVADPHEAVAKAEVVIDFSHAAAVPALVSACARRAIPLVCGTTNLETATFVQIDALAEKAPVLWAPNMSFGVQLLAELVEQAVRRLGPGYDVEIVEVHHNRKVDAPSGTAKRLVEAVAAGQAASPEVVHGREGEAGARTRGEVGMHAVRGGDVVGDHIVHLLGQGERLELVHRATSRDVLAHGALRAAKFLVGRRPGRYTIADVLGG